MGDRGWVSVLGGRWALAQLGLLERTRTAERGSSMRRCPPSAHPFSEVIPSLSNVIAKTLSLILASFSSVRAPAIERL